MIIDLHVHTSYFSSDSALEFPAVIEQARKSGIDGICIAEHGRFWDVDELAEISRKYDFPLFPSCEVRTDDGHVLVLGLHKYVTWMWLIGKLRQMVDVAGGVMILAHPLRRKYFPGKTVEDMVGDFRNDPAYQYVDIVETVNGRVADEENRISKEMAGRLGLRGVGGSDAHSMEDIPSGATEFERDIHSLDEMITELKAGRFRAVDLRQKRYKFLNPVGFD